MALSLRKSWQKCHVPSRLVTLRDHTVVIHGPSPHEFDIATRALQRGSYYNAALQDISMLFQTACIDARLAQPLLLTAPLPGPTHLLSASWSPSDNQAWTR